MPRAASLAGAAAAGLLLGACGGSTDTQLAYRSGPGSAATEVDSPGTWDLSYSWDCSHQKAQGHRGADGFHYTLYNTDDGSTSFEHPSLDLTGASGSGVIHFTRAGIFTVDVASDCDWRVRAVDTSRR